MKQKRWCKGFQKQTGAEIRIRGLTVSEDASGVTLQYSISAAEKTDTLWYRFPLEQKENISSEVADGVIVTLLPFAMRGGYNIYSSIPVSEQLWFQITQLLIPQLSQTAQDIWPTEIHAQLINPSYSPDGVATAMSCGVDSFTTFFQFTKDMPEPQWRINLLTFFENGAHHSGIIGHSDRENAVYQEQLAHVQCFCNEVQYPLLNVSSNLDSFLSTVFWQDSYHYTHAYRNAGFVLLLQKLIRIYYYAGARDITLFSASLWDDSEYYEKWLLPNLSTECTKLYSVSTSLNRIEKTRYISECPETYDHLLVCYAKGENCGTCAKCVRLLLTLDYLNLLECYKSSIPLQRYLKNKSEYEREMLAFKGSDPLLEEVYQTARNNGVHFSVSQRIRAILYRFSLHVNGVKSRLRRLLS